jgi:hypothetical protein
MHACEIHACEIHAHETHAHQMHTHEIYAHRSMAFSLDMKCQRTLSGNLARTTGFLDSNLRKRRLKIARPVGVLGRAFFLQLRCVTIKATILCNHFRCTI